MTNTAKLRELIKAKGLKYGYVAERLGLTQYGFSRKLENKSEFKVSEAAKLSELLQINASERDDIFFSHRVE